MEMDCGRQVKEKIKVIPKSKGGATEEWWREILMNDETFVEVTRKEVSQSVWGGQ